jgi:SAM-dependent methyltransferase
VRAAARYVSVGAPPWHWRIRRGNCPGCGSGLFFAFDHSAFHIRCLGCTNTAMNLSLIPVIASHMQNATTGKRVYEMSTYGATHDYLRRHFSESYFSEYFPDRPLGVLENGMRNEDATRLTFDSESLDLVTSNQVFEHVPEDMRAYAECFRVLKPGGALIFTVPLYDTPETQQVARLSASGQIEWLGTPEYHDARTTGPQTAPVFWRHSINDIAKRVGSAAGFRTVSIVPVTVVQRQGAAQPVVYAVK